MFKIEGLIVIARPIEEVFDFVVDGRNEPRYNPRMRRADKITDGPVGVATRFRAVMVSMGRPVDFITEITSYERPLRYGLSTHLSVMDIQGVVTFDAVPGGTRMRWSWDVAPRGVFKLAAPILARIGRHQERETWLGLKRVLERQTSQPVRT